MASRDILLDVSRLIWRVWRGGLPTGIDRVCLAYVDHFRQRAQAVIQFKGRFRVLRPDHSDELFDLFVEARRFRELFVRLVARAMPVASRSGSTGQLYLNLGHTGLDDPSLGAWVRRSGVRAVFLIHDLIPIVHPEYCRPGEAAKHRRRMANALDCAFGIIGNSQATLDDLVDFADVTGRAVPPSVSAPIAGAPRPSGILARQFERPHFVTVGTIEGRKNHVLLLQIWRKLVAAQGPAAPLLVIIGQRGWEAENAIAMLERATDLRGHVLEFGRCSDDELIGLLAGARALLMPSFAEGFGLPVAEALELQVPVIASDLPVFREFAGDIPAYLDPLDGTGWQRTILSYVDDCSDRQRQLSAIQYYEAPNWPLHFAQVEAWLQRLPIPLNS